jgi:hypothetical protein
MKYWEVIVDKLSAAGWSRGYCSAVSTAELEGVISLQNQSGTEGISYENDTAHGQRPSPNGTAS